MATIVMIFPKKLTKNTERSRQGVERQLLVVERQFQVVERQVAERRSGPFRLNLTTATHAARKTRI